MIKVGYFFKKLGRFYGRLSKTLVRRNVPLGERSDSGILVFMNTSEVIAAERVMKKAGFSVEIKGPPPELQTGCDMVVIFPLMKQMAIERCLKAAGLMALKILPRTELLLEPVSLYEMKDLGKWLMMRVANIKVTIAKDSRRIVNISGGGCPDIPWLSQELNGKTLDEAPEPLSLGHTLCCYCLQKAYDELKRIRTCG